MNRRHRTTSSTAPVSTSRLGGMDTPATLAGSFTAIGMMVVLAAVVAAAAGGIGSPGNGIGARGVGDLSALGEGAAVLVVFVSFLVGGWAAGRMARYDGGKNGILAAVWTLLLLALLGVLGTAVGDRYDLFQRSGLMDSFSPLRGGDTRTAVLAVALGVLAVLIGAYVGGRLGQAYHRRMDAALGAMAQRDALITYPPTPTDSVPTETPAVKELAR